MSWKGALNRAGRAKTKAVTRPSSDTPSSDPASVANRRGGRIDFTSSMDIVDEASQQSFPASDPPAWNLPDPLDSDPQRDRSTDKKNAIDGELERSLPTSSSLNPSRGDGNNIPTTLPPDRIAPLAYDLWESRGRPEGTDLEDWLQAEQRLNDHA